MYIHKYVYVYDVLCVLHMHIQLPDPGSQAAVEPRSEAQLCALDAITVAG